MGKSISNTLRQKVYNKSDGRCWYCGKQAEQIDHVHPVFWGGKNKEDNLVPVCVWCNKSKRANSLEDWRKKLSLRKGYSFTDEQRAIWGERIPKDEPFLFWFELEGLQP